MDLQELFTSCKIGDLEKIKMLVELKDVDINARDNWDSTPLYYACLCGHKEIVKFLLERGARCEANTFDGERCLYGALNNDIRNMLKSFHVISSKILRRDIYEEFLRRLLEDVTFSDVVFIVHGECFHAHRAVLSTRSSYFAELLNSKWKNRREINLNHKLISPWAFKALLQHLYTAHSEINIEHIEDYMRLARQCKLHNLMQTIEKSLEKLYNYARTKPGIMITTVNVESEFESEILQTELLQLANMAQPPELSSWPIGELPFEPEYGTLFADVGFIVDGHRFLCHKCFFYARTDYFRALLSDHFDESDKTEEIPLITLHGLSAVVFQQIVYYIYTDSCELTCMNVYEVLCSADLYLLPGLKRQCAAFVAKNLEVNQVINVLRTARLFNLYRLQDQCAEFIAANLYKVIQLEEFTELVMEDATNVKERQDTDSIEIIDNVRYYLTNFMQTFSEMQEVSEKLQLIDNLLEELNLEG
ncbi:ABTB1 [Acanthosepion pharaonis]|uniref:ABTB1 n=1 Tax=Acanthosepion pharaonis TaxID=158019 RepID=A0A812CLS6_ACAPH|nr:ABTB1 [Sepia pharaonis]